MSSLAGTCEVRQTTAPTEPASPVIATTCDLPAAAEIDITLPSCPEQLNPPLVFRVRLCNNHLQAYTGWH